MFNEFEREVTTSIKLTKTIENKENWGLQKEDLEKISKEFIETIFSKLNNVESCTIEFSAGGIEIDSYSIDPQL